MTDERVRVRAELTHRWRGRWAESGVARWAGPSGHASVAAQEPAESLIDHHLAATSRLSSRREHAIAESLMRAVEVVVRHELLQRSLQVVGAEEDQPFEALSLDGLYKALADGVHVRCHVGRGDDLDAGIAEDAAELVRELRVAVEDHELAGAEEAIDRVGEVARNLRHERIVGVGGDADDLDHAARMANREQHVVRHQPACGPDFGGEEVHRGDGVGVGLQERAPRCRPLRDRWHTVIDQRLGDGGAADLVAKLSHLAANARVAPAGVVLGHSDDQLAQRLHQLRTADSVLSVGVLRGDQLPMPTQQRVGRHDCRDGGQRRTAENLRLGGEPGPLRIGESQPAFPQLFAQDAVLFAQELDDLGLFAVREAGEQNQQEAQWQQGIEHGSANGSGPSQVRCRWAKQGMGCSAATVRNV
jgi:hypothetical protein